MNRIFKKRLILSGPKYREAYTMRKSGQTETGRLSEEMVAEQLQALGLQTRKPIPDRGVDLEAWHPSNPSKRVKIQIKARNPKTITSYRWFQIRIRVADQEGLTVVV